MKKREKGLTIIMTIKKKTLPRKLKIRETQIS
jgi:hypothetical protein